MTKRSGFLLTMVLLLLLTAVGPAAGGQAIDCGARPDHPHCQDPGPLPDHPDGGTCEASNDAWIAATDEFTVEFTDKLLCVDWTTTKQADWRITVWPNGTRESVWATVRDSHPGDWCWRAEDTWQAIDTAQGRALTAVMDSIPVAAIDACGAEYTDLADPPRDAIPFALTIGYKWRSSGVVVTVEEVTP
jgi:hypothetical protein